MKKFNGSFFASSIEDKQCLISLTDFDEWFFSCCKNDEFNVQEIPFKEMTNWSFLNNNEKLGHNSGNFFSIEGLKVRIESGDKTLEWEQPIINQPEIGILCFITKLIHGVRYFLVQAKMEPGNINTLQISPSLQATKSNFTCVHKGKAPIFLDLFMSKNYKVLVDQLQTEQGGRFLKKRNRNIIIEIDKDVPQKENFCWLSLYQIKQLMKRNNVMNMDSRSVLSMIPLIEDTVAYDLTRMTQTEFRSFAEENHISKKGIEYINSYITESALHSIDEILSWITELKFSTNLKVENLPLRSLNDWSINDYRIYNKKSDNYFSINAVRITAGTREVNSWTQPLIIDSKIGLLAFITKKINGILHFLIQAKVEPGNIDIVELSPTVSCSNYEFVKSSKNKPFLFDEIFNNSNKIYYDSLQSEEGGRFYKIQNRNMIIEISADNYIQIPSSYKWMTLKQMKEFMRYGMFNIEARSIISSINFTD